MDQALYKTLAYAPLVREWYAFAYESPNTTPRQKAAALTLLHENRGSIIKLADIASAVKASHGTIRLWQTRKSFIEEKLEAASDFASWLLLMGAGDFTNTSPLKALRGKKNEVLQTIPHLSRWAARECYRSFLRHEPTEYDAVDDLPIVQYLAAHFASRAYEIPIEEAFKKAIASLFAKSRDTRLGVWEELLTALKQYEDPDMFRLRLELLKAQRAVALVQARIAIEQAKHNE